MVAFAGWREAWAPSDSGKRARSGGAEPISRELIKVV